MRITLKMIAQESGLTIAAVSKALRGKRDIAEKTKLKVQAVAQRLGYKPDPLLSSLCSYRKDQKNFSATIAFLSDWKSPEEWRKISPFLVRMRAGMEQRAQHLGYRIEDFWLNQPGLTQKRGSQILFHRGVQGIVIPSLKIPFSHLRLDWSKFALVATRNALASPALNYVDTDHYQGMRLACHHLRHLGYHRIGLVLDEMIDRYTLRLWRAAYEVEMQLYHHKNAAVPLLIIPQRTDLPKIESWAKTHHPEIILGADYLPMLVAKTKNRLLQKIPIVSLDVQTLDGSETGINTNPERVGALAVDSIHVTLQTGEYGIPQIQGGFLVSGTWIEGKLPKRKS
jgi:LacI family transcriptional regulator